MYRTALDSEDLSAFNDSTDFILTYSDLITDPHGFESAHPAQTVVYIDRGLGDPGTKATIADVERFALSPADLPAWYDERNARHMAFLTVYSDRSTIPAVNAAIGNRPVSRWIATLDGTMHIDGFVPMKWPALVQTANSAMTGIHADFSVVLADGWHPSPLTPAEVAAKHAIDRAIGFMSSASAQLMGEVAMLRPFG